MSNAARMIRRRQWREDHPAHFNTPQKRTAAAALNSKLAPRRSFRLWLIEKLQPKKYAAMVELALGKKIEAGKAELDTAGEVIVHDQHTMMEILDDVEGARP